MHKRSFAMPDVLALVKRRAEAARRSATEGSPIADLDLQRAVALDALAAKIEAGEVAAEKIDRNMELIAGPKTPTWHRESVAQQLNRVFNLGLSCD
jgi:hypothetical protein